jgi:hypothetical protein
LLGEGEIDRATVEQEYLDAKGRYQAQIAAGLAWDKRTGLETLRKDAERRSAAEWRYAKRLARTLPTTPAGAAALIDYILCDELMADEGYWHVQRLKPLPPPQWHDRCGAVMIEITSVVEPHPGADMWSGTAKIGHRNLQWFHCRQWLHVQEQDQINLRCWMNIEPEDGWRDHVRRAIRRAKRSRGKTGK